MKELVGSAVNELVIRPCIGWTPPSFKTSLCRLLLRISERMAFRLAVAAFCRRRNNTHSARLERRVTNDDGSRKQATSGGFKQPRTAFVSGQRNHYSTAADHDFNAPRVVFGTICLPLLSRSLILNNVQLFKKHGRVCRPLGVSGTN